jgi:hypothetical protein
MIVVSIVVGRLITYTGRYKGFMLAGLLIMGCGYYLLTRLDAGSTQAGLTLAMIVVGLGLGADGVVEKILPRSAASRGNARAALYRLLPGPTNGSYRRTRKWSSTASP